MIRSVAAPEIVLVTRENEAAYTLLTLGHQRVSNGETL